MNPPDAPSSLNAPAPDEIEAWLSQAIAQRLRVPQVDPEMAFSGYGLSSLSAMRVLDSLETWLGKPLPRTIFFDYPNIRQLSLALASGNLVESEEYAAPDADCY
jgi:acyl carrier protein